MSVHLQNRDLKIARGEMYHNVDCFIHGYTDINTCPYVDVVTIWRQVALFQRSFNLRTDLK